MNIGPLLTSKDDSWLTPSWLCGKVLEFYEGSFFLDPAADSIHPQWTGASRWLTQAEDGLSQPWRGKVYLNPPYGRQIRKWVDKFVDEYLTGNMVEGLILVPARTETLWWNHLLICDPLLMFFHGRLVFGEASNSAPFPSALLYVGMYKTKASYCFSDTTWSARLNRQ